MCHRPGTWLSTNYQPLEVLPNAYVLHISGFFLDVLMALRPLTAFLSWPTMEFSSILTDFWRMGELSGFGDQATLLPMDPSSSQPQCSLPPFPRPAWAATPLRGPRSLVFGVTYGLQRRQRSPGLGPPETGTRLWMHVLEWWWHQEPHSHS